MIICKKSVLFTNFFAVNVFVKRWRIPFFANVAFPRLKGPYFLFDLIIMILWSIELTVVSICRFVIVGGTAYPK